MQFYRRKSRVSSWIHREVLRVWFRTPSGIVRFLVEFWSGILFEHDVQSRGVCSMWQGRDGRKHAVLGTFSFVLESERCGCQQRNQAQGGNFVIDSLSYWKPVQFSQKWWNSVCIWRFWKWVERNNFEPFEVCQSAVEESLTKGDYSNQGVTKPSMSQGFG